MANKSTTLTVKIVSDAKGAAAGFDDASTRVDRFSKGLDRASLAAGGVLVGMGALAVSAFNAASDLQQSTGAIESVFGDMSGQIQTSAENAAGAVGLSTSAYENLAAVIGAQLTGAGMAIDEATTKTQGLVGMGADLAATFGGTTADAVGALSSALKGEMDPLERYGVSIKQSDINARLAALGQDTLTGSALKTATANAALALITEQTTTATGAFARESDTAAGAQQRATASFDNAKAALGEVLLPVVADAATKFSTLTGFLVAHKDTVLIVGGVLAALAVLVIGVNAAMSVAAAVTTAWTAAVTVAKTAQFLWNLALEANPIGLVVTLIAALALGVYTAYQKFEPFRTVVDAVGNALKTAFSTAVTWAQKLWDKIQPIIDGIGKIGGAIGGALGSLLGAPAGGPVPLPGAALRGAAPGLFGASAAGGFTGAGTGSAGLATAPAGDTYQITVTGALDPDAVADQIERMLDRRARMTGRAMAAAL